MILLDTVDCWQHSMQVGNGIHPARSSLVMPTLRSGVADASIVVLAERHKTRDVLTLDQRHFRVFTANRKPFRILPADA
jgi:hypothetical protein